MGDQGSRAQLRGNCARSSAVRGRTSFAPHVTSELMGTNPARPGALNLSLLFSGAPHKLTAIAHRLGTAATRKLLGEFFLGIDQFSGKRLLTDVISLADAIGIVRT
jgi:hypothetical protein